MTLPNQTLRRRFKLAALLISTGLLTEAVTLYWSHPTTFLIFLFVGGSLVAAGICLYLFSIVT